MTAKWYQVGDERRKLTLAEAHLPENAGAVLIVCPECIHELETGEPVPEGIVHQCDEQEGLDLTFRLPTKKELEELEHPKPLQVQFVLHHFLHGQLKETEE